MCILDLDGTILDTIKDLCEAVNYGLKEFHLKPISIATAKKNLGYGISSLVYESSAHSPNTEDILQYFKAYYEKHYNDNTKPYFGVFDTLQKLKERGVLLGVLSNKVEPLAVRLCEAHFKDCFSFVYGEASGRKRKPDPEFLLEILDEYGIDKKEVLYVGDSEVDIKLARNAGIDGILVSYGFRTKEELLTYSCIIIDDFSSLLEYF